ncbi:MAG: hypothetical protein DRO88_05770 [Promethearchaeia archaeon]|nr:MAG: hypothetical protein DRO88_05770 [Candidatus Lokiarchaeia archaeon]
MSDKTIFLRSARNRNYSSPFDPMDHNQLKERQLQISNDTLELISDNRKDFRRYQQFIFQF